MSHLRSACLCVCVAHLAVCAHVHACMHACMHASIWKTETVQQTDQEKEKDRDRDRDRDKVSDRDRSRGRGRETETGTGTETETGTETGTGTGTETGTETETEAATATATESATETETNKKFSHFCLMIYTYVCIFACMYVNTHISIPGGGHSGVKRDKVERSLRLNWQRPACTPRYLWVFERRGMTFVDTHTHTHTHTHTRTRTPNHPHTSAHTHPTTHTFQNIEITPKSPDVFW